MATRSFPARLVCEMGGMAVAVLCAAVGGADVPPASAPSASSTQPNDPASRPSDLSGNRVHGVAPPSTQPSTRRISMNFKDAPLEVVLDHLSDAAGLIVIKEGQLDGRVTVQSTEPVSPEEAVTLLNTVLKANGFSAIQSGRVVRILPREKVKKGNVPVHVGSDPAAIVESDEIITQVIPLMNVDAIKIRQDLTPLVGTDADVTANEASNSIVITDSSANIRRVVQIINALDMGQSSSTELRVLRLKFANAEETAKLITSMFRGAGDGPMNPQQMQMMMMMQQQQQMPGAMTPHNREGRIPGGAIDQALHGGHVRADADARTNTLLLTAPAASMKVIEDIIKELDSNPVPASQIKAFHLNFADAEATTKLLSKLYNSDEGGRFPFFNPFGDDEARPAAKIKVNITADDRTNSVIVSAPAEAIKSIEDLIKDLDATPGTGSEIRTFQLKYADAYDTAKMIKSIFEPDEKESGNSPFRFIFFGPPPPTSKGAKVTATSDDRTNTLIVTGPKEAIKVVEELVAKLDSNATSEDSLFIYRLRNGQAANLETVLNTLFGNTNSQNQNNNGQAIGPNGQPIQQQQNQQGGGGRGSAGANASGNLAGGTGIGARHGQRNGGGFGQHNMPKLSGNLTAAINEMSGQVFVVADVDTNSLIVTTASKFKDSVRDIIKELDRPAPQVLIKVLVAEVTHDNSADWGLDFSILNTRPSGNGQTVGNNLQNAAAGMANGGLVVSVLETNLNATLHALATEGKLDVLSRPYILASDNQLATITVGQEVPFITNTQLTDTGQQINTIQYQDIGIILNVTPHINPEGLVILDVAPEISQLTGTTVPITAGVAAPIIAKRSAESRVGIKDGETIVIGGLMQDSKTSTISKIPLLGDIPFVGELFRRTQIDKSKTELLIFLTPHVALQPNSLSGMSEDEMKSTRLTPRAVEPGVFQEHLQGMQRGAGSQTQPVDPATTQPVNVIRGGDASEKRSKPDMRP